MHSTLGTCTGKNKHCITDLHLRLGWVWLAHSKFCNWGLEFLSPWSWSITLLAPQCHSFHYFLDRIPPLPVNIVVCQSNSKGHKWEWKTSPNKDIITRWLFLKLPLAESMRRSLMHYQMYMLLFTIKWCDCTFKGVKWKEVKDLSNAWWCWKARSYSSVWNHQQHHPTMRFFPPCFISANNGLVAHQHILM